MVARLISASAVDFDVCTCAHTCTGDGKAMAPRAGGMPGTVLEPIGCMHDPCLCSQL